MLAGSISYGYCQPITGGWTTGGDVSNVTISDIDQSSFDSRYVTTATVQDIDGSKTWVSSFTVRGNTEAIAQIGILGTGASGATSGGSLRLGQNDGTPMQNLESMGALTFDGFFGGVMRASAGLRASANGTWNANDFPSALEFQTTPDNSGTFLTRLYIGQRGDVRIRNFTADVTTIPDFSIFFATDVAGSSEMFVLDEAGNRTQISPHNPEGEWEFYSVNVQTGREVRINMENLVRAVEKITGERFMFETFHEVESVDPDGP